MFTGPLPNKTTFTKYCLTQWISKLQGSFEIHRVRPYLVNVMGLAGIVNGVQDWANFHRPRAWQIVLIFNTVSVINIGSDNGFVLSCNKPLHRLVMTKSFYYDMVWLGPNELNMLLSVDVCMGWSVYAHILVDILQYGRVALEFNSLRPGDTYMWHWTRSSLAQVMAYFLFGCKPSPESVLSHCQSHP